MTDQLKQWIQDIEQSVAEKHRGTGYTDSYVAFLDICGMKELVKRPYEELRRIFNVAESGREVYGRSQVAGGRPFISQDHLKMTIMSDALVLSIASDIEHAFSKLIGFSSYLINGLLKVPETPVFLRGGISRGPIFQDANAVFGPGLVDAYNLENSLAKSMRCIVSPDLEQDVSVQEYLASSGCALVADLKDGLHFINFAKADVYESLMRVSAEIIESDVSDNIKDKYKWLIRYVEAQVGA